MTLTSIKNEDSLLCLSLSFPLSVLLTTLRFFLLLFLFFLTFAGDSLSQIVIVISRLNLVGFAHFPHLSPSTRAFLLMDCYFLNFLYIDTTNACLTCDAFLRVSLGDVSRVDRPPLRAPLPPHFSPRPRFGLCILTSLTECSQNY